jgi:hypothetical protein
MLLGIPCSLAMEVSLHSCVAQPEAWIIWVPLTSTCVSFLHARAISPLEFTSNRISRTQPNHRRFLSISASSVVAIINPDPTCLSIFCLKPSTTPLSIATHSRLSCRAYFRSSFVCHCFFPFAEKYVSAFFMAWARRGWSFRKASKISGSGMSFL